MLFAASYAVATRAAAGAGIVLAVLVVSHWLLDVIAHRPDMPLTVGGAARVGLGLWHSIPGTLLAELLIFFGGVALYMRATVARDRAGAIGFWSLVVFLLVVYLAATFGPPPPDSRAVAWSAEAMWLLVAWGFWVDRHRRVAGR